jgi:hypothetical protein
MRLSTQLQLGDFNPFMPEPYIICRNTSRPMTIYVDCFGEYLGRSQIPYCYPEQIQHRILSSLEQCSVINTIRSRVNFADSWNVGKKSHLFDTPNEINFIAMRRIAESPEVNMDDVWLDWARQRYGAAASRVIIRALRRSVHIVRNSMSFSGAPLCRHSQLRRSLDECDNRFRGFFAQVLELIDDQVEERQMQREIGRGTYPAYILDELLLRQKMAQSLCDESIRDIESVRSDMDSATYEQLAAQFRFTGEYLRIVSDMVETWYRVRMAGVRREPGNDEAIHESISRLEEAVRHAKEHYDADCIVQPEALEAFLSDVRLHAKAP